MTKEKKQEVVTTNNVIFRDTEAGVDFYGTSTKKTDKIEKIDGVDYYIIQLDISSASHPFYTGKDNIIDKEGMVDKFKLRAEKATKVTKTIKKEVENKVIEK